MTNLERNLYLTTQVLECGLPVVIGLNMCDLLAKSGDTIDAEKLSSELGVPCIEVSALRNSNLDSLIKTAKDEATIKRIAAPRHAFAADVDGVQDAIDAKDPTDGDEETIATFEQAAAQAGVIAYQVPLRDADGNYLDTDGNVVDTTGTGDDEAPMLRDGEELETIDEVDADAFATAIETPEPDPADYGIWVPSLPGVVSGWLEDAGASPLTESLIVDGIIAGVGSVLGFVPQMVVLFLMLCFLEDCGYMSRVAFVMDRVFRKFGLSGKSFIPMLISSGCGVPGIMATKTIESESDRRMTIMTTTMIPCGAKLPIISLLMGVLIGGTSDWWIAPLFYFLGVGAVIVSGIMLKKTKPFAGDPAPFVMELPVYHLPAFKSWMMHMWERVKSFLVKAGTVIFLAAIVIWFLSDFGIAGWEGGTGAFGYLPGMDGVPDSYADYSVLAGLCGTICVIFAPLGFGTWQATATTISGLIAKENLVGTFAVLSGIGSSVSEASTSMWGAFAGMFTVDGVVHVGGMFAFVAFNLLCAPCFAAMGAMRRQMDDSRWWWFAVGYECGLGWVVGLVINQLYELFTFGSFGFWTAVAFFALACLLFQLFRPMPRFEKKDTKVLESLSEVS